MPEPTLDDYTRAIDEIRERERHPLTWTPDETENLKSPFLPTVIVNERPDYTDLDYHQFDATDFDVFDTELPK